MHRLAKLGFTQSYTYFTWRNTKQELVEYFTELTAPRARVLPAQLWPNTPDILPEYLQIGGGRRRSACAWCWPRRSRRATASTARRSS